MNAKELYQTGIQCFQKNQFKQGVNYLLKSAKLKYSPAIKEIGLCFLYGIGVKESLNKAIKYFKVSQSEAESQFELSKLYYFGHGLDKNKKLSKKLLISAAKQDYIPAINLMAVCYQINNQEHKAQVLFSISYANKDPFATHLCHCNYVTPIQEDINFIEQFKWPKLQNKYKKNKLNKNPSVFTVEGLFSDIECEYIKYVSSPYMQKSMTIDPTTGQRVTDKIRTSHSSSVDWHVEDPAVNLIMKKCCKLFKVKTCQSEVLHVLHYSIGEQYKPHYDFLGGLNGGENFDPSVQRIKSICIYLNEVKSGGETSFPKLDIKVIPQKGTAIFFENVDKKTKQPYIESLHAGQPVIEGEKWLATLWIRNQDTKRGSDYDSVPTE
jgi:prolyl 4-hydroxylase